MKDYFRRNFDVNLHTISKNDLLNFKINKGIPIIESDKSVLTKSKRVMAADPFIIKEKNRYYVFFEDLEDYAGHAVLKMQFSDDLKHWSVPKTILKENFHLSFPCVIKDNENYYMLPETVGSLSVRLYKASSENLDEWKLCKVLIQGKRYCDSTILKHNGMYYLFATKDVNMYAGQKYELHLYISKHIEGPYTIHPKSPVCVGNKFARNGGGILTIDGRLFRPAQDCEKEYGTQLHMLEITKLTPTEYSEIVVKENILVRPGHHLSMVKEESEGQYILCTDSKVISFNLYMSLERIKAKLTDIFDKLKKNKTD